MQYACKPCLLHRPARYTWAMDKSRNLVWIDLEMTGLDPQRDSIIEIATIVTDPHLNELAVGPVIAIRQTRETMAGMDEWNTPNIPIPASRTGSSPVR